MIKVIKSGGSLKAFLDKKQSQLNKIPFEAHKFFVSVTPKDTGNARKNTRLKANVISADYDYATRLNQGWSKQAPQGMIKPLKNFLRKLVKQLLGAR